jgi:hypothetical protein
MNARPMDAAFNLEPGIESWHNQTSLVPISATGVPDAKFVSWIGEGDGNYTGPLNPHTVTMNSPITETANFTAQTAKITVATNPKVADRIFIWVDSQNITTPHNFTWTINSKHTLLAYGTVPGDNGIRYGFSSWSDSELHSRRTYIVQGPATITANYTTQYQVNFTISGIDIDATGTIATITTMSQRKTMNQDQLRDTDWYNFTSRIDYAFLPTVPTADGKRYSWRSTSGLGQTGLTGTFNVTQAGTVTGNYGTQYELDVKLNPESAGSVQLDGSTIQPGPHWLYSGSTVNIEAKANDPYRFVSWIGEGDGNYTGPLNPHTVTMNSPITETANFGIEDLTPGVYSLVAVGMLFAVLGLVVEHRTNPKVQSTSVRTPPPVRVEQRPERPPVQRPQGICQSCGHGNRVTARFCTRCGTTLSKAAA